MEFLKIGSSWVVTILVYVTGLVALGLFLAHRAGIMKFLEEVKVELSKCTWPWNPEQTGLRRYKELIDSTVVVAVSTLLLGSYVSMFDFFMNHLVGWMVKF